MSYGLFLVLNFLLLVRPEDLYPPIAGLRLYLITIVACTVTALPELQRTLTGDSLRLRPIAVCALALLPASFLSFLVRGRPGDGLDFVTEFGKVVLFFLLLISVINTPERLRNYCGWVALFITCVAGITLLDEEGIVDFEGIAPLSQWSYDAALGQEIRIERVISVGLFSDPNDLCVICAFGLVLCVGMVTTSAGTIAKFAWVFPMAILVYIGYLTKSRGGLMALGAGVGGIILARVGWRKSMPLIAVGVAGMLYGLVGGGDSRGTSHERLMLWANGLGDLFRMPFHILTGLAPGYYMDEFRLLAHNSYVNAYVETGLIGGGLFLVAFYTAVRTSVDAVRDPDAPDWSRQFGPYLIGAVCSYALGCYSLTRNFHIPTYLVLGIAAAYTHLSQPVPDERYWVTGLWWRRVALLAAGGLVFLKYVTQGLGLLGV
jgi:putative inorganic carbon (HCO3(-)) transporter